MIQAVGKLQEVRSQTVGNNFALTDVDLEVAGRPLRVTAKGQVAYRVQALLEGAPEGSLVEIYAEPEFRENNGNVYMDLVALDALLLGNIGTEGANFRIQGFIEGVKEVAKKDGGTFELGVLRAIAFDRNGDAIPGASIEVTLDDEGLTTFRMNAGQFVLARGTVSGWKAKEGRNGNPPRVYPRFTVNTVSVAPVPAWLADYAPEGAEVAPPPAAASVPQQAGDVLF